MTQPTSTTDYSNFDWQPEDSWSPGDPPLLLVQNLVQRIVLLIGEALEHTDGDDLAVRLEEIEQQLLAWRRARDGNASERDEVRAADIVRHIAVVRAML